MHLTVGIHRELHYSPDTLTSTANRHDPSAINWGKLKPAIGDRPFVQLFPFDPRAPHGVLGCCVSEFCGDEALAIERELRRLYRTTAPRGV